MSITSCPSNYEKCEMFGKKVTVKGKDVKMRHRIQLGQEGLEILSILPWNSS